MKMSLFVTNVISLGSKCSNTFKLWCTLQQSLCCKFLDEFNSEKISKIRQYLPKL